MRRKAWTPAIAAAVVLAAAIAPVCSSPVEEPGPKLTALPPTVRKAVEAALPGARVGTVEVEVEAGVQVYDVELADGRGEIEVACDGTVIEVSTLVRLEDVPEAAAKAIREAAGPSGVREVERAEVRARLESKDGKGRLVPVVPPAHVFEAVLAKGGEVEVDTDGRIVERTAAGGKEPSKR